ncbi:acyl-CoA thioesterase [Limisphaera ngatamarikiensis]|jgi:acyl-CoA thioester hydrolase|uniref:Acyl-CoA thioesterase n=1 Tax=Limisphaera ngatamarikiensis TaxID=1324935 RepID=A0A6M1RGN2_9BACT|nr:acyl-CoA thioesterase [Limisphaera ngatamarikiensis]NGO38766.1 acyl-CoA thioesterase [Limisphaera ngatamarikiensis]
METFRTVAPYESRVRVEPADIDPLGHVNNVVYLRWAQDVAVAHWQAEASPEAQERLIWVVLRHEVDYKHPARLGDEIRIVTRVGAASRFRFERWTEMFRARDGRLLVRVRTLWCPLDRRTGRLTEVGPEVRARFSTGPGSVRPVRAAL